MTLALLSGVSTTTAAEELDIAVINGTAIPYAKEDHLAYGIVKLWNKADVPITVTLSISPNRDHRIDDNRYWGNYREEENIKIEANELRIQIFCFTVPAGNELGQQVWTLNVTTEEQVITKKIAINLPVTKNVEISAPSWKPDILKLELPPAKPDTFTVEAGKPSVIVMLLDIAGDVSSKKVYDVEFETSLPDVFFSYPEEIRVEMSKPKSWDFDNQTFLPFTIIPIPLLTANVPCSSIENMYKAKLQLEEEGTDLKASLPFQLVVEIPKTTENRVANTTTVNETVNNSEIATTVETIVAINLSRATKPIDMPEEKTNDNWTWSKIDQLNDDMWNFIISKIKS
ncbi:MAG: hypothetical protein U9P70_03795 [Patescibacteria group bacterium]|nr:hypothetical protein [Patescibacteria group bacterium]